MKTKSRSFDLIDKVPKIIMLLIFVVISQLSIAQPEITSSVFPKDGVELMLVDCDVPDPQANIQGADVIWDFSGLAGCNQEAWIFTAHDTLEDMDAEAFPEANKSIEINIDSPPTDIFIFNNVDESNWTTYGINYNGTYGSYIGGETILQFPAKFGDTWMNDNVFSILGSTTPTMSEYNVDGYGTLILPNATYENVIRIHSTRDETAGLFTVETYTYYSSEYQHHLMHMLVDDEVQYQINPKSIVTSTKEINRPTSMNLSPNPSSGNLNVQIELSTASKSEVTLYSNLGERLITKKDVDFTRGFYNLELPHTLDKGIYFVQVVANGNRLTSKLIIQ